jgi:hypothetical protein
VARETVIGMFQNPGSAATDPAPASVCQRPYVDSPDKVREP